MLAGFDAVLMFLRINLITGENFALVVVLGKILHLFLVVLRHCNNINLAVGILLSTAFHLWRLFFRQTFVIDQF